MEKNLFEEIDRHLTLDDKPSDYLRGILHKLRNSPLKVISDLEKIEQNPQHHPEGNVLNHTLLVVDAAAMVRKYANNRSVFMWSALMHDLGKLKATKLKKGRITAYDHDVIGAKAVNTVLDAFEFLENDFKNGVEGMVKYHMHSLYLAKNLPFGSTEQMILDVDMHDMILLFFADKLGRGDFSKSEIQRVITELIDTIDKLEGKYNIDLDKVSKELMNVYHKAN